MADFYQQILLNSGYLPGRALVQARGSIGGHRYVFVKLQMSGKDALVFPTTGCVIKNPFKGMFAASNNRICTLEKDYCLSRFSRTCFLIAAKLSAASCSHFATEELFIKMLRAAAKDAHRQLRQIEVKQQAPDHPILWGVPETNYLKFFLFQVI